MHCKKCICIIRIFTPFFYDVLSSFFTSLLTFYTIYAGLHLQQKESIKRLWME